MSETTAPETPFDRFIAHLRSLDLVENAVGVGQRAPDFLLASPDGKLLGLADILAEGPVVVSFIRGEWCPICRREIGQLAEAHAAIRAAGARLVAITPECGAAAAELAREQGLPFPVLCDTDLGVALDYGLVFRLTDEMCEAYRDHDLPARQQHDGWLLPIPATYVLDRDGIVRFAHVDVDYRNRMTCEAIQSALAAIARDAGARDAPA